MAPGISAGRTYIAVAPDLRGWARSVKEQLAREWGRTKLPAPEIPTPDTRGPARESGANFAGEFDRVVRTKITAALKSLPDAELDVNSTAADRKIKNLRDQLTDLSTKRIGIDVSADTARARLNAIQDELQQISGDTARIDVQANTLAASVQLANVERVASKLDGTDVNIDVDARGAGRATSDLGALRNISGQTSLTFGQMAVAAATLGSALIPLAAAAGAVGAALLGPLAAAGAGLGALTASITGNVSQVLEGQKDLETAQKAASTAATALASAQDGVKTALEGVKQAQQGVITAQINADRAVADSLRAVADARTNAARAEQAAQDSLADARTNAARAEQAAQQSLAQARVNADRAVQSARQSLAGAISTANQSVATAEDSLRSAQDQARAAQEALTDAREAARQKLADYSAQLRGAALDESGAELAVRQAQQALEDVQADPKATQLQIDLARQALKEARFNYKETQRNRADLRKQAAEDRRQGIKGDDAVKDARDALADANDGVRDAEQELADTRVQAQRDIAQARQEVIRARVDGAREIAQAEKELQRVRIDGAEAVADAQREVRRAQIDGAEAIAEAERQVRRARVDGARAVAQAQQGVVSAQRQVRTAQEAAAAAAAGYATAQGDVADAMSKLDGPAAGFVTALDRAKNAWNRFLDATAGPSLGLASKGLKVFSQVMPRLAPLANTAARAVGDLLGRFGRWMKGPEANRFLQFFQRQAGPAIRDFGSLAGNLARGIGNLVVAFAPLGRKVVGWLVDLSDKFARFTSNKKNLQPFLDYVERIGPKVADTLGSLARAAGRIVQAFAPIGEKVLDILKWLADRISDIPIPWLTAGIVGLITVMAAWKALRFAASVGEMVSSLAKLRQINLLVTKSTWAQVAAERALKIAKLGLVGIGIAAVIAGLVLLYKKNEWFRNLVDKVWGKIKAVLAAVWNWIKGTLWPGIKRVFGWIGDRATWLWENALGPAFRGIGKVARWLWDKVIKPVFSKIGDIAKWLWEKAVKPYFTAWKAFFTKVLFPVLKWLWDKIVKPVFSRIGDAIKFWWNRIVKPVFAALKWYFSKVLFPVLRWLWEHVVKPVFKKIGDAISFAWHKVIKPVFGWLGDRFHDVGKGIRKVGGWIKDVWDGLGDGLSAAFEGIKKVLDKVLGWIGDVIGKAKDALEWLGKVSNEAPKSEKDWAGEERFLPDGTLNPNYKGNAAGGLVRGPGTSTSDSIPRMLSNGEYVMPAQRVAQYGFGMLEAMRRGTFRVGQAVAMAAGGLVGPIQHGSTGGGDLLGALRDLVWILRRKVVPALLEAVSPSTTYGDTDSGPKKRRRRHPDGNQVLPRVGLFADRDGLSGFDKSLKKSVPEIDTWNKRVQQMGDRAVGLEMVVGKSAKKVGKYWTTLRRGPLDDFLKDWHRGVAKDAVYDANMLQRGTDRVRKRLGDGLATFRRGPMRGFSQDWGDTFRSKTPDDVATFRVKTLDQLGRTRDGIRTAWADRIKPVLHDFGQYPKQQVVPAFAKGTDAIGKAWEKVEGKSKSPIKFVIQTVLNRGLIGAFNKIAKFVNTDELKEISLPKGFKSGGVLPGYTPGRDVHVFRSRTAGNLALSGGEAIMRPEWTRAVGGPAGVRRMNEAARRGQMDFLKEGGVFWPTQYGQSRITTPFGQPGSWAAGYHTGVDFDGETGDPITNVQAGKVVFANYDDSYGNLATVRTGGWDLMYGHLSRLLVKVGQALKGGGRIGLMGNTGRSFGDHLHLELRPAGGEYGTGIDPMRLFEGGKIGPGNTGLGGPMLPGWARNIVQGAKTWAKGLLDGGDRLTGPFGQMTQAVLNELADPIADWAMSKLGGAGMAGNFGPGASGVWKSLMSTGWYSKAQAAGVMGNVQSESGFDHDIVEGGGSAALPIGIDGGWGLVQWTPGWKVLPYLNGDGSVGSQINALTAQLQGKGPAAEAEAGQKLKATSSVRQAAIKFLTEYERPADQSQAVKDLRAGQAQAIYRRFAMDRGGLAYGAGLVPKLTRKPERWLSPRQTEAFEQMVPLFEHLADAGKGKANQFPPIELAVRFDGANMTGKLDMLNGDTAIQLGAGRAMARRAEHVDLMRRGK